MNAGQPLSVDILLQQYRISRRKPVLALEAKRAALATRLNALAGLRTALVELDQGLRVMEESLFWKVQSSSEHTVAASVDSPGVEGRFTVRVVRLARSDALLSAPFDVDGMTIAQAGAGGENSVRVRSGDRSADVVLSVGVNDTDLMVLARAASALNAAEAGVTAMTVSNNSNARRLLLSGCGAGSSQAVTVEDLHGGLMAALGLTPAVVAGRRRSSGFAAGFVESDAALLDGLITVDGRPVLCGSNRVHDAIPGIVLDLRAAHREGESAVISAGPDREHALRAEAALNGAFSAVLDSLGRVAGDGTASSERPPLAGYPVFRNLADRLRSAAQWSGAAGALLPAHRALRVRGMLREYLAADGHLRRSESRIHEQQGRIEEEIRNFDAMLERDLESFAGEFAAIQTAIAVARQQQTRIAALITGGPVG